MQGCGHAVIKAQKRASHMPVGKQELHPRDVPGRCAEVGGRFSQEKTEEEKEIGTCRKWLFGPFTQPPKPALATSMRPCSPFILRPIHLSIFVLDGHNPPYL